MSEVETHFGKLRRVHLNENHTTEDWARERCHTMGITFLSMWNKTWFEQLRDHAGNKYHAIDGEIWEVFDHKLVDERDIDLIVPNPDGTLTFMMQFYNGGTCLSECLEEGISRHNKKQRSNDNT